jgi:hypothetical protein
MDFDLSTLLPIILAVLYYVFTGANKKKKKAQDALDQNPPVRPGSVGPPPVSRRPTFEELLEEFTGEKKVEEKVEVVPELVPEPFIPIASVPKPSQSRLGIKDRKEYKTLIRLDEYNDDNLADQEDYKELFSDLDSAKRAFISSEIYNRKY